MNRTAKPGENIMAKKPFLFKLVAIITISVLLLVSVPTSMSAQAAKLQTTGTFCDQYYSTSNGNYQTMTNYWNKAASAPNTECINITTSGFSITTQDQVCATNGAPCSYPAIYIGCHYSTCSPNTNLPAVLSSISAANTTSTDTYSSGTFDASYDIWINADTNVTGVQDTEIMIWLNKNGSIQPIGSQEATNVSLGGYTWNVWSGNNGQNNVVSYMSTSAITSFSGNVMVWINDAIARHPTWGNSSWYLTSIQDGFEPWSGGTGLAISNFSASVTIGGGGPTPTFTRTNTPSGPTATFTRTPTPGAPTATPTKTATPGGGGTCNSGNATTITSPFNYQSGATGEIKCWRANNFTNYVQAYTANYLKVNGVSQTVGVSIPVANLPAKQADGYWYFDWSSQPYGGFQGQ
jgi:hypothetical protein